MMTFHIDIPELAVFFAILLRLSIALFLLPLFSSTNVPATVKTCVVIALTLMLYPLLRRHVPPLPLEPSALLWTVLGEIVFGLVFALSMLVILGAFQAAGELISFEMGFGFTQVADPQGGAQMTLFSMWMQLLATLIFFSVNGHHILLRTFVESFRTVPVGTFTLSAATSHKMILLSGQLFILAIKMAAPVMIVLLLVQMGLGLMSKFAPQINILMTSFPLTIAVGLLFMSFSMLIWGNFMEHAFVDMFRFLRQLVGVP